MEYIDIPSSQLLPGIEEGIKNKMEEQMKALEVLLPDNKNIEVDKVEWTAEGIRVWMVTEK